MSSLSDRSRSFSNHVVVRVRDGGGGQDGDEKGVVGGRSDSVEERVRCCLRGRLVSAVGLVPLMWSSTEAVGPETALRFSGLGSRL